VGLHAVAVELHFVQPALAGWHHFAPFRPMHAMRRQGRNDPIARMGWTAGTGASVAGEELADCANKGLLAPSLVVSMSVPNLP